MKYFILGFIFILTVSVVTASERHHTLPYSPTETVIEKTTIIERVEGIALGIAHASLQFDPKETRLQWSVGAGTYENDSAFAFGLAKDINCILLNMSVGSENGNQSLGIGLSGKF